MEQTVTSTCLPVLYDTKLTGSHAAVRNVAHTSNRADRTGCQAALNPVGLYIRRRLLPVVLRLEQTLKVDDIIALLEMVVILTGNAIERPEYLNAAVRAAADVCKVKPKPHPGGWPPRTRAIYPVLYKVLLMLRHCTGSRKRQNGRRKASSPTRRENARSLIGEDGSTSYPFRSGLRASRGTFKVASRVLMLPGAKCRCCSWIFREDIFILF